MNPFSITENDVLILSYPWIGEILYVSTTVKAIVTNQANATKIT